MAASLLNFVHMYTTITVTVDIISLHDCITYPAYTFVYLWTPIAGAGAGAGAGAAAAAAATAATANIIACITALPTPHCCCTHVGSYCCRCYRCSTMAALPIPHSCCTHAGSHCCCYCHC